MISSFNSPLPLEKLIDNQRFIKTNEIVYNSSNLLENQLSPWDPNYGIIDIPDQRLPQIQKYFGKEWLIA